MKRLKDIPFHKTKEGIVINIKVETRSSRAMVVGPYGDGLKVKLTAPPVDGAANRQLIEILAKYFKVKKASIRIIKGQQSKNKAVEIQGLG